MTAQSHLLILYLLPYFLFIMFIYWLVNSFYLAHDENRGGLLAGVLQQQLGLG